MQRLKALIVHIRAAQIYCLMVKRMMVDHLGQNDVHDALFTAGCLSTFVFLTFFKQRVCQFRGPQNLCVSSGRHQLPTGPSFISTWTEENCQM